MTRPPIEDYLAICETKARYCRCLDEKDWAGYADVYTPDTVLDTSASGGSRTEGRDALVASVRGSIGEATTVHQVHSPEMTVIDANTVDVIWAMMDRVIFAPDKAAEIGTKGLTGYGHYRQRYVRCDDGVWRIASNRLTRLHMEIEPLASEPA